MSDRETKDLLFEQVARIGQAVSSRKRLELLNLLVQGEKTVEALAAEAGITTRLASAHLKVLREARLVEVRREGKHVHYRPSGADIASLWVTLHTVAGEHLLELRHALAAGGTGGERLAPESRARLLERARRGEVVVIDVRPESEYRAGHLPSARSLPLTELEERLAELPADCEIVAYCRGPFCLMAGKAVSILNASGLRARTLAEGVAEWRAAGIELEENKSEEVG